MKKIALVVIVIALQSCNSVKEWWIQDLNATVGLFSDDQKY